MACVVYAKRVGKTDRWISIISFRSIEVDFVADGGFRLIDTEFRKFWWISWISWISRFRPTLKVLLLLQHLQVLSLFEHFKVLIKCSLQHLFFQCMNHHEPKNSKNHFTTPS